MRVKVTVNIDQEIYEKSHALGINVSKACENYLKQLNEAIENTQTPKNPFLTSVLSGKKAKAGPTGIEPATPGLKEWVGSSEQWHNYLCYLEKQNFRGGYERTLYNYTQRFADGFLNGDLSSIRDASVGVRKNGMSALSAFATYLGARKYLQELFENFGIDWSKGNSSQVIIDRLLSVDEADEVWNWVRTVKKQLPDLVNFMDLMSVCGLRLVEGVNCNNVIINLTKQGCLELDREGKNYRSGYFNSKVQVLEHFWFADLFLRGNKNVYVSYAPGEIVKRISECQLISNANSMVKAVRRLNIPSRFSDIREAQNTFMVKYLKPSEIDFLSGRMSSSVFMTNYFNPSQIGDLQSRVFQGIVEIMEKVKL